VRCASRGNPASDGPSALPAMLALLYRCQRHPANCSFASVCSQSLSPYTSQVLQIPPIPWHRTPSFSSLLVAQRRSKMVVEVRRILTLPLNRLSPLLITFQRSRGRSSSSLSRPLSRWFPDLISKHCRNIEIADPQSRDREPEIEGFPMKLWNIEIYLLDEAGNPTDSSIIAKAIYNLHPSFTNPVQSAYPHFQYSLTNR
jgi:hypothetical protein